MTTWKTFPEFFGAATGGCEPYPYQTRFADMPTLPHLLRAPTGAGKTATAVLGWLWRLTTQPANTPRRLVYCLPMRVLVEQSHREAERWLDALGLRDTVCLPQPLMGGSDSGDWHLYPEKPAILIGTQDMLLSRALNRGYAATRFHWPIDFGLLNNDCLWIFDEPQLMANGVSTSAQLAGLRHSLKTFSECSSVWMSATLEPGWLDTVDFRGKFTTPAFELDATDYATSSLDRRMSAAKTLGRLKADVSKDMKDVAKAVLEAHEAGTQTLVVLNTVDRAKAVYAGLVSLRKKSALPKLLLVHSRFRPHERQRLNDQLQEKGEAATDRIIVATQVVEAGVDISARTLITELAPWASVVQRIGRCNRTGDDGTKKNPARVFWIDLDAEKQGMPYEATDLAFARQHLLSLDGKDVSPKALDEYKKAKEKEKPDEPFLKFSHKHVLRRRDLLDLFDTAPDLSGNDIDVSRFVRSDEPDTDVQVFWRDEQPRNDWNARERRRQAARREELCNVPISSFKEEFLKADKTAYRFDHLDGEWQEIRKRDVSTVVPGQVFWIVADQGGYDAELGWSPSAGRLPSSLLVPLPAEAPKRRGEREENAYDSDDWAQAGWRTLADHTDDVVRELTAITDKKHGLPIDDELRAVFTVAARWHDWGKAHPIFQSGIAPEIDDPKERREKPNLPTEKRTKQSRPEKWKDVPFLAKAPDEFWRKYTRTLSEPARSVTVKRFRHELASALGVLALEREAKLPQDWMTLSPSFRWLGLYLIAAHHGKLRLSIRTMPDERPIPNDAENRRFAAGVWDGDTLPSAPLGGTPTVLPPAVELSLEPMQLGGEASWTAAILALREEWNPFRLAYLEALLRAADCRASGSPDGEEASNE